MKAITRGLAATALAALLAAGATGCTVASTSAQAEPGPAHSSAAAGKVEGGVGETRPAETNQEAVPNSKAALKGTVDELLSTIKDEVDALMAEAQAMKEPLAPEKMMAWYEKGLPRSLAFFDNGTEEAVGTIISLYPDWDGGKISLDDSFIKIDGNKATILSEGFVYSGGDNPEPNLGAGTIIDAILFANDGTGWKVTGDKREF